MTFKSDKQRKAMWANMGNKLIGKMNKYNQRAQQPIEGVDYDYMPKSEEEADRVASEQSGFWGEPGKLENEKLSTDWIEGDIDTMSSDEFAGTLKHNKGIKKPTAIESTIINGKKHFRYYYKPIQPGEFWD